VYVFLKISYFSSVSFVYFLIFVYSLGGNIYLSLASFRINVYAGKMSTKYDDMMCQNRSLKQTLQYVLYEPHFILESRFREMSWLSVYLCLWLKAKDFYKKILIPAY